MPTYFIADLHLSQQQPKVVVGFLRFLKEKASQADALYILGDFFELWLGDDDPEPLHQTVSQALRELTSQGVKCYFIHGNRDFLLGKKFAQDSGLQLLAAETVIDLYGEPVLIMHGDTLCSDDKQYQRFRRLTHNRFLQMLFLLLPFSWRKKIGLELRDESQQYNQHKSAHLMDINQLTVESKMLKNRCQLLIHGHIHKAGIYHFSLQQKPAQRIVLGDWHNTAIILKADFGGQHHLEQLELFSEEE